MRAACRVLRNLPLGAAQYAIDGQHFKCLDGSTSIPATAVNDNYCDCPDGSDEPGTSACPRGTFWCANKGHKAELIPASRVNDGICDCCDGSEEFNGVAQCEDTCLELGREAREQAAREAAMQVEGFAIRQEYVKKANEARTADTARVAELEAALTALDPQLSVLEKAKDEAAAPADEAEKAFDEQWEQTKASRDERAYKYLFDRLDVDGDATITPVDVLGTVNLKFDANEDGEVDQKEIEVLFDDNNDGEINETETSIDLEFFSEEVYEDVVELFEDEEGFVKLTSDNDKPEYDESILKLREAARAAKKAYDDLNREKQDSTRAKEDLEKKLTIDFGEDKAFAALMGECFEVIDAEYKYRLCMFDKVTQEPKNGGSQTNLGKWDKWEDTDGPHRALHFDHGTKCWNGPERSMTVTLSCGTENKIMSVLEPNRCTYTMRMETPAVCSGAAASTEGHDEL